jgi:predicted urease superfamily metal-dependent hydrolase
MDSADNEQDRKITLHEAAVYLGVSPGKISRMVRRGQLEVIVDPLDMRKKLVSLRKLEELKRTSLKGQER